MKNATISIGNEGTDTFRSKWADNFDGSDDGGLDYKGISNPVGNWVGANSFKTLDDKVEHVLEVMDFNPITDRLGYNGVGGITRKRATTLLSQPNDATSVDEARAQLKTRVALMKENEKARIQSSQWMRMQTENVKRMLEEENLALRDKLANLKERNAHMNAQVNDQNGLQIDGTSNSAAKNRTPQDARKPTDRISSTPSSSIFITQPSSPSNSHERKYQLVPTKPGILAAGRPASGSYSRSGKLSSLGKHNIMTLRREYDSLTAIYAKKERKLDEISQELRELMSWRDGSHWAQTPEVHTRVETEKQYFLCPM